MPHKRLRDLGSIYGGLTSKTKSDFDCGEDSYVTFLNVVNNMRVRGTDLGRVQVLPSERQNRVLRGDILFNTSSETPEEVALSSIVDFDPSARTFLNSFCFGYRVKDVDVVLPIYVAYFFRSSAGRRLVAALAQGATRYNIAKSKFLNLNLKIPTLQEQRDVVEALTAAEDYVASIRSLIAKNEDLKRGVAQQLLTGRTRLPGFSSPWTDKRLGEVLTVRHGRSQASVESQDGRYPILATGGQIGWSRTPLYSKPSVLIGRKGTIDRPQYQDQPFWTVDTLFYTDIGPEMDPRYLYYLFLTVDWRSMNEASGVPSLSSKRIEGVDVSLPALEEQVVIRQALDNVDSKIAALRERLFKAEAIKEGMQQRLVS